MLEIGQVVRSTAGHDKQRFYVVVERAGSWVIIADGKMHKLETPKRKNPLHLAPTHKRVPLEERQTNKALRKKLEPMNQSLYSEM